MILCLLVLEQDSTFGAVLGSTLIYGRRSFKGAVGKMGGNEEAMYGLRINF